jgi:hypothetical protein
MSCCPSLELDDANSCLIGRSAEMCQQVRGQFHGLRVIAATKAAFSDRHASPGCCLRCVRTWEPSAAVRAGNSIRGMRKRFRFSQYRIEWNCISADLVDHASQRRTLVFRPRSSLICFVDGFLPVPRICVALLHFRVTRFRQCLGRGGLPGRTRRLIDGIDKQALLAARPRD